MPVLSTSKFQLPVVTRDCLLALPKTTVGFLREGVLKFEVCVVPSSPPAFCALQDNPFSSQPLPQARHSHRRFRGLNFGILLK